MCCWCAEGLVNRQVFGEIKVLGNQLLLCYSSGVQQEALWIRIFPSHFSLPLPAFLSSVHLAFLCTSICLLFWNFMSWNKAILCDRRNLWTNTQTLNTLVLFNDSFWGQSKCMVTQSWAPLSLREGLCQQANTDPADSLKRLFSWEIWAMCDVCNINCWWSLQPSVRT